MSTPSRQPAGVPSGGQFAASTHAEPLNVTLDPSTGAGQTGDPVDVPDWGDLDSRYFAKVAEWEDENDEGGEIAVLDLLGFTEPEAAAIYGPKRAEWLASLELDGEREVRTVGRSSFYGPADEQVIGTASISRNGKLIESATWGEDGIDLGYLTRKCPYGEDGGVLYDPNDPDWNDESILPGAKEGWVTNGFRDPRQVIAWVGAGFSRGAAVEWDARGFAPDEARSYADAGMSPFAAARARNRKLAEDLAAEEARIAGSSTVGTDAA